MGQFRTSVSLIAVNHDCTDWTNLFSAELVVGSRRIGTIDGGWTTTHIDSQRNGFLYFLATRTVLMRHFRYDKPRSRRNGQQY
jgi:hypothetical protein